MTHQLFRQKMLTKGTLPKEQIDHFLKDDFYNYFTFLYNLNSLAELKEFYLLKNELRTQHVEMSIFVLFSGLPNNYVHRVELGMEPVKIDHYKVNTPKN